ncbi:MAG: tRNA (adenosine(37)-N6)-threonylcarbamoyltransferase complex transferase subunit TsaD, partial [Firmicutes bacterium]|nr:tRNA (adenosine(37)-N6)-threonylcarbamoyltransferase complex transferase subunit TsaD [Bacillota bacterium]
MRDIITLGIETSCDETSAAVVKNGVEVLSNVVASQIEIHKRFLGVVPEVASRNHVMAINNIYSQALEEAKITKEKIDIIAVTYGAGLSGALLVGVSFAKALSYALNIPLIKVNHIKGHIAANYLKSERFEPIKPPFICLVVSGGHTALLEVLSYTTHKLIGTTADDACGEAFDKVARVLGLDYPGGIYVDNLSRDGKDNIKFPKMLKGKDTFNFSYSGLKTAVINYVNSLKMKNEIINKNDICKSFTVAAIDPLVEKSI